jgi:lipoate-protein ligase A
VTNPAAEKDKIRPLLAAWEEDPATERLFRRLEVIADPQAHPAVFNMALDEALLEHAGATATLRIYRWLRPALSIGYFQRFTDVRTSGNHELVRRWTGGGSVEHGADFTYSLIIPGPGLAALGAGQRTYALIHRALGQALSLAGAAPTQDAAAPPAGAAAVSPGACFVQPVAHDLLSGGRKIAGAAQRRTRRGLLHQGSVQGIEPLDGWPVNWRDRLAEMLPGALCLSPAARPLSAAEESRANDLAATKYATDAWSRRF